MHLLASQKRVIFFGYQSNSKNLETLLDFVQMPYFTKETVEKEKRIIGQEIQMYDDDPNWQQFLVSLRIYIQSIRFTLILLGLLKV